MYDFVICICAYGAITDKTFMAFENLRHETSHRYDIRVRSFDALIGRSRSCISTDFLKTNDSDYMIFVDTDIVFKPKDINNLITAMQQGYDIVAGAYSLADGSSLAIRSFEGTIIPDGKIHEVEYVSTGFLGISRKALELIRDKLELPLLHEGHPFECYPFFESGRNTQNGYYISEDWDFCDKAREAGLKVCWHTGVLVGHYKSRVIPAEEAIKNSQYTPQQVSMKCPVQLSLMDDLAEFLGLSVREATNKVMDDPAAKVAEDWNNWEGNIEDFYRQNKTQIFDLVMFNRAARYWQMRVEPIWAEKEKRVLDYGCGIGSVVLYMAMNRHKVVGYDINPYLIDFCNFRKEKFGLSNVEFTTFEPDLSQFDLILAIDMLEHIEDLHSFIQKLGKEMKVGARLYHQDVFGERKYHPMHFDHSLHIRGWLEEAGFLVWDDKWAIRR